MYETAICSRYEWVKTTEGGGCPLTLFKKASLYPNLLLVVIVPKKSY